PPMGLPANTTIYVTIILYFFDKPNITCFSYSFTTQPLTTVPECTELTNPTDLSSDVNPNTNISWAYVYGAEGYRLSLGTTAGGTDLLDDFDVQNTLTYNPTTDLPAESTIYATVVPYNSLGNAIGCTYQQFATRAESDIPDCTNIIYPQDGETNVPLSPLLEWYAVPNTTGYIVTIGTTPSGTDILDGSIFYTSSTPVVNFEPNKTFFIWITPFNEAGQAEGCIQTSFTTIVGCGPYLDFETGEYITINPTMDFPDSFSTCQNDGPLTITAPDIAEGYRWYSIDEFENEMLISTTKDVTITANGLYRYEIYNTANQDGNIIECPTSKVFEVVSSQVPTIEDIIPEITDSSLNLTVIASGMGDYEYAIDDIDGPYSDNNIFNNVSQGNHKIYVRDKNGCGIASEEYAQDLTINGFPNFFTPNGDSVNDYWQFIQPQGTDKVVLKSIRIFDRYGNFLKQISPNSLGWDGNLRGRPLPSDSYWFVAINDSDQVIKGHFALKR
ncbi:MAG: T9SS type B sorting domain-containing protein, partial [Bacteroidota bacterium]|nr:T9SS type B sorting domain-containing protein [Bacteroidota bacterium]